MKLERVAGQSAEYSVEHATDGRDGTSLRSQITLAWSIHPDKTTDVICSWPTGAEAAAGTPKAALQKMAGWLERTAAALRVASDRMPELPEHELALSLLVDTFPVVFDRSGE